MAASKAKPVDPHLLRRKLDPEVVPFASSDQAPPGAEAVLGQDRAKEALEFGLAMRSPGFHVYVAGPDRTGKTHLVRSFVEKLAAEASAPRTGFTCTTSATRSGPTP